MSDLLRAIKDYLRQIDACCNNEDVVEAAKISEERRKLDAEIIKTGATKP